MFNQLINQKNQTNPEEGSSIQWFSICSYPSNQIKSIGA